MTMEEMNDMSLLEGAADNADLLEKLLKASLIHADETYQTPPQIIWVDNSTIATLGNFSASTGKAKSRKTFNVSASMQCLGNHREHDIADPQYSHKSNPLLIKYPIQVR